MVWIRGLLVHYLQTYTSCVPQRQGLRVLQVALRIGSVEGSEVASGVGRAQRTACGGGAGTVLVIVHLHGISVREGLARGARGVGNPNRFCDLWFSHITQQIPHAYVAEALPPANQAAA